MGVSEALQKNPTVTASVAGIIILFAIGYIFMQTRQAPAGSGTKVYYYDMQSGELFTDDASKKPPIEAPSGGEGVLALVYSCGDCANEDELRVGNLQRYTDQAKTELAKDESERDHAAIAAGSVIALPPENPGEDVQWVSTDDMAGMRIMNAYEEQCADAKICKP